MTARMLRPFPGWLDAVFATFDAIRHALALRPRLG